MPGMMQPMLMGEMAVMIPHRTKNKARPVVICDDQDSTHLMK